MEIHAPDLVWEKWVWGCVACGDDDNDDTLGSVHSADADLIASYQRIDLMCAHSLGAFEVHVYLVRLLTSSTSTCHWYVLGYFFQRLKYE